MGKIGIFDSGIGGVSVFLEIRKLLPNFEYLYLSDSLHLPYGDKSQEEILDITIKNVEFLILSSCDIIVFACNTATAACIDEVRKRYPNICFVGIEPAVKMVYDRNRDASCLLLATSLTLSSSRVSSLLERYPLPYLKTYSCVGLADLIDICDMEGIKKYILEHFSSFQDVSYVILGCTHYPLVLDLFQDFFKDATIFHGGVGVAQEVYRKALELHLSSSSYSLEFVDTAHDPSKRFAFEFYCQ